MEYGKIQNLSSDTRSDTSTGAQKNYFKRDSRHFLLWCNSVIWQTSLNNIEPKIV